jgi:hypothetical protein
MAYDGELVKMENGRWARFQRCQVYRPGVEDAGETMLLIAVELEERYQQLLDSVEESLAQYRHQGIPVQVRIDPDAQGVTLQPETAAASFH